ncbi:MAG: hypothetical protein DDT37_01328 [Firmicutes bacterium]|nr:hypothetical protein [candidate division NPL-UPA2 bacterium]MBT9156343.1 hypothetical protein [candidate division NPL-UPA2 bacterium]
MSSDLAQGIFAIFVAAPLAFYCRARLVLHAKCLQGGRELKNTIRNIFEGRLTECDLCELCNSVRPTQEAVEP